MRAYWSGHIGRSRCLVARDSGASFAAWGQCGDAMILEQRGGPGTLAALAGVLAHSLEHALE